MTKNKHQTAKKRQTTKKKQTKTIKKWHKISKRDENHPVKKTNDQRQAMNNHKVTQKTQNNAENIIRKAKNRHQTSKRRHSVILWSRGTFCMSVPMDLFSHYLSMVENWEEAFRNRNLWILHLKLFLSLKPREYRVFLFTSIYITCPCPCPACKISAPMQSTTPPVMDMKIKLFLYWTVYDSPLSKTNRKLLLWLKHMEGFKTHEVV